MDQSGCTICYKYDLIRCNTVVCYGSACDPFHDNYRVCWWQSSTLVDCWVLFWLEVSVCLVVCSAPQDFFHTSLGLANFTGRKSAIMIGGSLTALGGTLLCAAVNVW